MLKRARGLLFQYFRFISLTVISIGALAGCGPNPDEKSLFEPNAAPNAVKKILAKLKQPVRVLSIEMTPSSMAVQVQDPSRPDHVDAYTYSIPSGIIGRLGADWVTGPEPVQLNLINPRLEENLFNLTDVDFSRVAATVIDAITRSALDDPGEVTRILIRRRLTLLPTAQSGPVEWNLEVRSGRESAEAYADAAGQIQRMDVSQTRRAQTLDIMAGGKPVADAFVRFREFFGSGAVLKKASFSRSDVSVVARKAGQPPQSARSYHWNLNGLTESIVPMITIPGRENKEEDFFAVDDVDWSKLAQLTAAAIEKTEIQGGRITGVDVERVSSPFSKRPVEWRITVEPAGNALFAMNRDEGVAFFSPKGDFTRVELPKSRRVPKDFLAAETMKGILPALHDSFGAEARFMEVGFDDRGCNILAPGPKNPEKIQSFTYEQDHFSGMPNVDQSPFYKGFTNDWLFSLEELEKTVLPTIAEREKDTLARLRMPEGKITRVTFHRHSPFYPGNKKLLIEIRASGKAGDGYVVYDDRGGVLDVITP